ncbi:uncharacterized protein B0J16DRAFT_251640, partial [Fusarium flagelliforme]|uniref:uncharacterized protein n=1 Tax=Fusarium flagelliforme TaxID=2675880 RepID=UPI001E8E7DA2
PCSSPEVISPPTATKEDFQRTLRLVQYIISKEQRLTRESLQAFKNVRKWQERWGWSPLNTDKYSSPLPYSPCESQHSPVPAPSSPILIESSPSQQSESPPPDEIPNPPIPGNPVTSAEALFKDVQLFAKEHGFSIAKYNKYSYKGRLLR